ncbi:hypothetical protein NW066_04770 [Mycoplasmopsis felis]|nr:hypothetical protein [Mycoplasmopsis felis]UWV84863.1 hypothetical protein NW066_04770 [Mycoplasmopsis felis]
MLNRGGFINDIHIKNEDVLLILKKSRRISFKRNKRSSRFPESLKIVSF